MNEYHRPCVPLSVGLFRQNDPAQEQAFIEQVHVYMPSLGDMVRNNTCFLPSRSLKSNREMDTQVITSILESVLCVRHVHDVVRTQRKGGFSPKRGTGGEELGP